MNQFNNTKNITIEYYNTCSMVKVDHKTNTYSRAKTDISELLEVLQKKCTRKNYSI